MFSVNARNSTSLITIHTQFCLAQQRAGIWEDSRNDTSVHAGFGPPGIVWDSCVVSVTKKLKVVYLGAVLVIDYLLSRQSGHNSSLLLLALSLDLDA